MHHKRGRPKSRRAGSLSSKTWKIPGAALFDHLKPSENRRVQPEEWRPPPKHRADRQRWCRGKVGIEHDGVCVDYYETKRIPRYRDNDLYVLLVCRKCGKELDSYFECSDSDFFSFMNDKRPKPSWVTR